MKNTGSYQQEHECERVEEEGQGIKRMTFRSGIKMQYKKLESEVCRKNIYHLSVLRDGEKEGSVRYFT